MARPLDTRKRAALLADVTDYLARHGIAGLSLRPLAAELGTSSRMLVYYFATKENLLSQALEASRPEISELFADITSGEDLQRVLLSLWEDITSGGQRRSAPLMLQVMALAVVPDSAYTEFAAREVTSWVDPLAEALMRCGQRPEAARARATALVSGTRGLLLDRLVTHDHQRTDAAVKSLITALLAP
ncbi:TetR/AcrR family transcriptional regulator [Streptomyces stramineus]|uniref:TetR/AcrR family transcriptional regulator n=1 Tax=Streptomyces stramineus TaxID=173861 RepID=A0ABN0ZEY4_9ACTN